MFLLTKRTLFIFGSFFLKKSFSASYHIVQALRSIDNKSISILLTEGTHMAHLYSKGWFIKELKAVNVTKIEGRKLEIFKTYILRNLYIELVEDGTIKPPLSSE